MDHNFIPIPDHMNEILREERLKKQENVTEEIELIDRTAVAAERRRMTLGKGSPNPIPSDSKGPDNVVDQAPLDEYYDTNHEVYAVYTHLKNMIDALNYAISKAVRIKYPTSKIEFDIADNDDHVLVYVRESYSLADTDLGLEVTHSKCVVIQIKTKDSVNSKIKTLFDPEINEFKILQQDNLLTILNMIVDLYI